MDAAAKLLASFFDGFDTQGYDFEVSLYFKNETHYRIFDEIDGKRPKYIRMSVSSVLCHDTLSWRLEDWRQWIQYKMTNSYRYLVLGKLSYIGIELSKYVDDQPFGLFESFTVETFNPENGFEFIGDRMVACVYTEGIKNIDSLRKYCKDSFRKGKTVLRQKNVAFFWK